MPLLVSLFLILFLASPAYATKYWVGSAGSDSNACSAIDGDEDPGTYKATIGDVEQDCSLQPGDVIHIKAGTYTGTGQTINEQVFGDNFPNGTVTAGYTTIEGEGMGVTTVKPPRGFRINEASYIKFYNLTIDMVNVSSGADDSCIQFAATTTASGNLILDHVECMHAGNTVGGVGAGGFLIAGDSKGAPGTPGVITGVLITHCIAHDNGNSGFGHGFYIRVNDLTFEYTHSYNNSSGGMQNINNGTTTMLNPIIRYNSFHGNKFGLAIGSTGGKIYGNLIYGNTTYGANDGFGGTTRPTPNVWHNNIFYNNDRGLDCGLFGSTTAQSCSLTNNVFIGNSSGDVIRYNNWTISGSHNACTSAEADCGTSKITIAAITDITVSTTDFRHKSGGSGINAGTTVSTRVCNGTCDLGPFESFNSPAPTAQIDLNLLDIQLGMSSSVPAQVLSNTFTVACSGHASCPGSPTVSSVTLKSGTDSVIRLTISGITGDACANTQTWTWSTTAGGISDSALIGGDINQEIFAASNQDVTETCSGSPTTPPTGDIHYLMDEGTGTSVNDEEGGDEDGTRTNSPPWVTSGISFTADANEYVAVPYGNAINASSQSLTMCADVEPTVGDEANNRIVAGTVGSSQRYYLGRWAGFWGIASGTSSISASPSTQFAVTTGRTLICIVGDATGDVATLWVNGVKGTGNSVKAYTGFSLGGNLQIGATDYTFLRGGHTVYEWWLFKSAESDQDMADLYAAWSQSSPTPTGTYEQKTHKWQRLRNTGAGAAEDFTQSGTTNGITIDVVIGGAVALVTQVDCTLANCDPTGLRLFYNKNGGAFTRVPNSGQDANFYGTPDVDVVSGTIECCLTGALTENDGPTNTTTDAVPVIDLAQNASFVRRSIIKLGTGVSAGDTLCFKEYHQTDLALNGGYTPSAGACLTVGSHTAGVGF